jgi:RNA polymerase sigma-B factor
MRTTGTTTTTFTARTTPSDIIVLRIKSNRERLVAARERLARVRSDSREHRQRAADLGDQIRRQLATFAEGVAAARLIQPRSAGFDVPVLPRFTPARNDPLDALRSDLHDTYAATHDPKVRSDLMSSYDGFARSLALKFRHRESVDDLVQVARIGLLHAIDRFDPEMGRPFPLFARITITGELKRHIRDKTWSMRVPRSLQEDYLNVMRSVDELTAEQSDSPSMESVAERCGMSVDRVLEAMELRLSQRALSIDAPPTSAASDEPVLEIGREDAAFDHFENRELVANLLARLPERDRRIVELRFMEDMTQSEIAAEIGVSQMCVSRVLARTLGRLRLWARTALN